MLSFYAFLVNYTNGKCIRLSALNDHRNLALQMTSQDPEFYQLKLVSMIIIMTSVRPVTDFGLYVMTQGYNQEAN